MYIVRMWEGLGNQMFQYAFALAVSNATNQQVYIDVDKHYEKELDKGRFTVEREVAIINYNLSLPFVTDAIMKKWFFLKQHNYIEKKVFEFNKVNLGARYRFISDFETGTSRYCPAYMCAVNAYCMGAFQSEKYFRKYRRQLLREFTPKRKIILPSHLRSKLEQQSIGIQIRRGDYVQLGLECRQQNYYNALEYLKQRLGEKLNVFIFSDNIRWVKENMDFQMPVTYLNENNVYPDYEELLILSRCKHQVISNSTFGWWAAWLNRNPNKIVIVPTEWSPITNIDDICPLEWIRVEG